MNKASIIGIAPTIESHRSFERPSRRPLPVVTQQCEVTRYGSNLGYAWLDTAALSA